jgi:hypothetical protein
VLRVERAWLSNAQKLYHARSLWHCLQYHGLVAIHSQHVGLLYSRGLVRHAELLQPQVVLTHTLGPAGMVWGWFLASMFIFFVGLAMADLGSAMPTSGGLYWLVCLHQQSQTRILTTQVDALLLFTSNA